MGSDYQMPPAHIGLTVIWWPHVAQSKQGPSAGYAAIVTQAGDDYLKLAVLFPGDRFVTPKEPVRHKDHPNQKLLAAEHEAGVWGHAHGGGPFAVYPATTEEKAEVKKKR